MRYELIHFCEIDGEAVKSYCTIHNENIGKNLGNIEEVDERNLKPFNFMVGGTPCQDFSISGARKGAVWKCKNCNTEYNPLTVHADIRKQCPNCGSEDIEKTRSSLLVEWLRILKYVSPDVAIYENVKNILSSSFNKMFGLFIEEVMSYGYNIYMGVLNSKGYGIPQNRERLYIVMIKQTVDNGKFKFPDQEENIGNLNDFLLPVDMSDFYETRVPNIYIQQSIKPSVRKVYERDIENIISCKKDMYQCLVKSGFQDCKVGLTLAPTLRAGNPHTAVFDGKRIRKLEPLENVLLMGFEKEDYEKMKNAGVSNAQIYKQTGNSIVVNVLLAIYRKLYIAMPYLFNDIRLGSFFSGIGAFEKALVILKNELERGEISDTWK